MSRFETFEDELEYLINKVDSGVSAKTWIEAVDELDLDVHTDTLRKSFGGGRYGGYNIAKYYRNKIEQGFQLNEPEQYQKLENLKDEIIKERIKLSDANRTKRQSLRDEARFEVLLDALHTNMETLDTIQINKTQPIRSSDKVTAVLQLSDWHVLKNINNQFNLYNADIVIERVSKIISKTIQKSKIHGVTDLIVEINGDMVEGIIQVSARNGEECDVVHQILFVSELLAKSINELLPNYETLKVVTTLGNHGRIYADKKMGYTHENFEMLIPEFLQLRLGNNVPIITSDGMDFVSYEIGGELICVAHGQNDKMSKVIVDFAKMYKRVPKEIHLGHYHAYKDINDCDIMVTVNGSLVGTDDYAISLRKVTKPAQNFIVYDGDDRCIYSLVAE